MTSRHDQRGLTVVEFALVGLLAFILLFGCLEFGRGLYTANSLVEATRRAARIATVCPLNHPSITDAALFSGGLRFPGLAADNIEVAYLDANGAPTGNVGAVAYVRVAIDDYQLPLNIPVINPVIDMPRFATTLPAESLGLNPDVGPPFVRSGPACPG